MIPTTTHTQNKRILRTYFSCVIGCFHRLEIHWIRCEFGGSDGTVIVRYTTRDLI